MKQLLITLLFLSVTHALWSQETERKSTSILFDPPVENRWELGATARTLLSYQTYQNTRYKYDDKFLGLGLGIYADYKVNNVWSLRWEAGVDANLGLTPYLSFQTHHRFAIDGAFMQVQVHYSIQMHKLLSSAIDMVV
ncbi:hypothetical protein JCM19294_1849 [Nonlabens tegetincola]|uniref:Uncharacterized protein n=1 Tax=Nonlabens tegetincola TaxID=323273 RepID=A0A090QLE0_9FLAO|nr:hypothetical protein [Nonlabens tegetincola]GAK96336.1 hypothetical protein JCM19294_1849 [Nonlabens tegetincola]